MEQTTQQITQKPSLPIKTKIAGWWICIAGLILMVWGGLIMTIFHGFLFGEFLFREELEFTGEENGAFIFFAGLFFSIIVFYLLKGKKWAWWILTIVLPILTIFGIIYYFAAAIYPGYILFFSSVDILLSLILLVISLFPSILFLLDRKNFFKIAS